MKELKEETKLRIATISFFIVPIIGAAIAVFMPTAQAHYVESDPNHAHVCTSSSTLNIRQSPDVKSKKLGQISQGKVVQIKASYTDWDTNETWYKVKSTPSTNNVSGYVSSTYLCF